MHVYGEEEHNEYITKAASSVKGALGLIEAAFEKDYGRDGVQIERQRKRALKPLTDPQKP